MINHDNTSPIGFFDSGVGGLSVYAQFKKILPNENTIYYGDLKNMPYGNKSKEQLIGFARNILNFFQNKNVKAVVIACNTSSAIAYDTIKNEYNFKIYPIIQSCAKIISLMPISKIGVFATSATINSNAYKNEIQKYNKNIEIIQIPCPDWTNFVEGGLIHTPACFDDIKNKMDKILEYKPQKIILGCTHYPYLMEVLSQFAPEEMFIDPAKIFVDYINVDLQSNLNPSIDAGNEEFYVSANPDNFIQNAQLFYNIKALPKLVL